jgi:ribose-phosphate pyrophosphokinase
VEPPLEVHAFEDTLPLAEDLARRLEANFCPIEVHRFPDEESLVRVESAGARRAVLVRSLDRPNPKLIEILFAADALRRRGVRELVLVAPYLGYMRQDRVFHEGEAVSQRVVAGLLGDAFDEVLTIEAHLHRIQTLAEIFSCPAREGRRLLLVGPDAESEPWVRAIAEIAELPFIVCQKTRSGDREVQIEVPTLPADVEGALIVDDIASSGATLAAATRSLKESGIERVEAIVSHALFGPRAEARLQSAGLERILSTDTLPHPSNAIEVGRLIAAHLTTDPSTKEDD